MMERESFLKKMKIGSPVLTNMQKKWEWIRLLTSGSIAGKIGLLQFAGVINENNINV